MADIVIEGKDGTKVTIPQSVSDQFGDKISAAIKKGVKPQKQKSPIPDGSFKGLSDTDNTGKMFPQLEVIKPFLGENSPLVKGLDAAEAKFKKFTTGPAAKLESYFRNFDTELRPVYARIQETFGGIPTLGGRATNELARQMQDSFFQIQESAMQLENNIPDHLVLEVDTGNGVEKVNLIDKALDGAMATFGTFNTLIEKYANTLGPKFAKSLEGQAYQVQIFNKGLGLSQEQIATLLSRQIALTGEASSQMMDDIRTQSYAIADAVGGNAKLIAQQSANIIGDVKNFGNVTVEEATRMAASMQNAGIEFSAFTNMLGKFQNFESATRAMSDLTAVFGVHMDSMELMQLANEDQEAFMFRIKEGFESQGLAMEDMNLQQKRILADTMGVNVQQAELFFADGALPDQEAMEQASLTANAEEAIKRLNKDILNIAQKSGDIDEIVSKGVNEQFTRPLQEAAYRNANVIRSGAMVISRELKAAANESGKSMLKEFEGLADIIDEQGGLTGKGVEKFLEGIATTTGQGVLDGMTGTIKATKGVLIKFRDAWWKPNIGPYNSPSKFFGMPLYLGIMDGIYKARDDIKPEFTKIAQGASEVITNTGLPKLLKELTETAELATGIASGGTSDLSQNIQTLNTAAADNFPKMVEQLEELNTLLSSHIQKIQEGTETELKVALNLDTKEIYESIYNYKHPSGGTVKFNSGKT